jgi:PBP1b-binding outer membrane lipoprotein LpoB
MKTLTKLISATMLAALLAACASTPAPVQAVEPPPAPEVDAKTTLENGG